MLEESTLIVWLLIASLVLNLVTMTLVIILLKRKSDMKSVAEIEAHDKVEVPATKQPKPSGVEGIVFCRHCGNQHESSQEVCPNCKTPR